METKGGDKREEERRDLPESQNTNVQKLKI